MSNPADLYFQNAQLSMAAYANLTIDMSAQRYKEALTANGFTDVLADQFIATYSIAEDTFADPATGLAVTLFQKNGSTEKILAIRGTQRSDVNDLLADGLLSLGETPALSPQYRALQDYYSELIQRGKISPTELITVTGHSLGGFLAQALTVDNATSIAHTYTFNAPGTGGVLIEVLQRLGVTEESVPSNLITNIISKNGVSVAAGFGTQIGIPVNIFIETATTNLSFHDHQIATATDALAFYDLISAIDPHVDIRTISNILEASATQTDLSLEAGLDALRILLLNDRTPTPSGPSGLGDLNREAYYANLMALRNSQVSGNGYHIIGLSGMPSSAVFSQAKASTPDGLAFRYALRELNPFVVTGVDYQTIHNHDQSLSLYDATTGEGYWTSVALSDRAALLAERLLFNTVDGIGSVTLNNARPTHFLDMATNFEVGTAFPHTNDVIFGTAENDPGLDGRSNDDHLYGGSGNDVISGLAGRDYLEGNAGDDEIYGGSENDILLGQQGRDFLDGGTGADRMSGGLGDDTYVVDHINDVVTEVENGGVDEVYASANFSLGSYLENLTLTGVDDTAGTGNELNNLIKGNSGNNRLTGMRGDDLLEGGVGFDTYVYHSGDGRDRIEDSDAQGQILFDDHILHGGVHRVGDAANTYTSLDGLITYVMSGTDLIVNGTLIVNENFQSGQMGIQLMDVSGMPKDAGVPSGPFSFTLLGDDSDGQFWPPGMSPVAVYANGGNDLLNGDHAPVVGAFSDLLDGGPGNDVFFGGYGDDYMVGGSGDDYAYLTEGDMFIGGDGDDYAVGNADFWDSTGPSIGSGAHYADGGLGNDTLMGEIGADVLLGGEGDDTLRGENRPTGWLGLIYDNTIWKRTAQAAVIVPFGGDDYLDGGAGNDLLIGDGGNDILIGGTGDDRLYGESDFIQTVAGDDWLDGGAGNDWLAGGSGADLLSGGDGDDLLIGDFVEDPGSPDVLDGGAGADELQGGGGDDILYGGVGMDRLAGFAGNDFIDGGGDDDEIQGGAGDDSLWGGTGNDRLTGQEDDDIMFGEEGDDELQGDSGSDTLLGGAGNDVLLGQDGEDFLSGEAGDDLLKGGLGHDELHGGNGIDDVQGQEGDDYLSGGAGDDFMYGDGSNPTAPSVLGGRDILNGEDGDDQLWGGGGDDQLFGGEGIDQLVGDVGDDYLYGNDGDDSLFGDSPFFPDQAGADLLDGGQGNDVLQGGGGDDRLEGGSGDDILIGDFSDLLGGAIGDDDLHGGLGNDRLVGGDGLDTYRFNLGDGIDSIEDNAAQNNRVIFGIGITAEDLRLEIATGDSLLIRVGSNGDVLGIVGFGISLPTDFHSVRQFEFGDGTQLTDSQLLARGFDLSAPVNGGSVRGTAYADHIEGSPVADVIHGGDGNDLLIGGTGDDVLEGDEGDDQLDGGAGNDRLYGGSGSNVLGGGEGNDRLESAGSGDQLFGGMGDDSYHLWSASQFIIEDVNAGTDIVYLAPSTALTYQTPDNIENVAIQEDLPLDPTMHVNVVGNDLDNQLSASNRLDGRGGNDILIGVGDNTFVFGRDYQHDTVQTGTQMYARTAVDNVEFLPDITPTDLALENSANDLVIKVHGTTDQLTVASYFTSPSSIIDQFLFGDGTVWDFNDIESRVHTFIGSAADDTFYGTLSDDTIRGLGGNDQIRASVGNDILDGGTGNDFLEGWSGNDTYVFGRGYGEDHIDEQGDVSDVDTLQLQGINPVDITLRATPDFMTDAILAINNTDDRVGLGGFFSSDGLRVDRIEFADGTIWDYNEMLAHTEGVTLEGTEDSETLSGNVTDDTLSGLGGDDILNGGAGHDSLHGGSGSDQLNGSAGNDVLDGGIDADVMSGGSGNDIYVVDNVGDTVTEQTGQGTDTVQSNISYTLGANLENLTLTGNAAINGTGNSLNNTLVGNSAANVLSGGTGNDIYILDAGDSVIELSGQGTDTIQSAVTYTLGSNLENLTLIGIAAIDGTGNGLSNTLVGNSAANTLNGGTGADAMSGGAGDDTYIVDNSGDTVTEYANGGSDTLQSSLTYTLSANVENLMLTGTSAINGTGNTLNNVLTGNTGANVLNGGAGADSMAGGAGNDTYVVDNVGDVVTEFAVGGTDLVQSAVTYALGAEVENLTLTGTSAINGTGNSLNNSLHQEHY